MRKNRSYWSQVRSVAILMIVATELFVMAVPLQRFTGIAAELTRVVVAVATVLCLIIYGLMMWRHARHLDEAVQTQVDDHEAYLRGLNRSEQQRRHNRIDP